MRRLAFHLMSYSVMPRVLVLPGTCHPLFFVCCLIFLFLFGWFCVVCHLILDLALGILLHICIPLGEGCFMPCFVSILAAVFLWYPPWRRLSWRLSCLSLCCLLCVWYLVLCTLGSVVCCACDTWCLYPRLFFVSAFHLLPLMSLRLSCDYCANGRLRYFTRDSPFGPCLIASYR